MRASFFAAAAIAALAMASCTAKPAGDDTTRRSEDRRLQTIGASVESVVRARLAHPQGPASISVAIIRNGEMVVQRAWGLADARAGRPATEAMTYRIGSVAKQFTAALILKLVDRGALSLSDTLARFFTDLDVAWQRITIAQLLNHTEGLQRDYRQEAFLDLLLTSQTNASRVALAARERLAFAPGTSHSYSNTGYMVLGAIVEQLYGKPYRDVIRDEIARPLGLTTLDWCTMKDKRPTDTIGHVRSPQGVLEPAAEVGDVALGGGLCATAGDLGRWNLALHGGRVLSPASYTAMITPRGAAESERYGFGIRVLQSPSGAPILTHDGNTITFVAENAWYPAEALSVTVLYNSPLGVGTSPMGAHLARIAMGEAVPDTVPTAGVANPERLVGFYEGRPGRGFAITLEGGTLYVQPTGNSKVTLMQQAGTTYAADAGDATLTFTIGADGRATGLIFRAGPREQIFPKVR